MKDTMNKRMIGTLLAGVLMTSMLAGCMGNTKTDSADASAPSAPSGTISVVSREDGSGTRGAFV